MISKFLSGLFFSNQSENQFLDTLNYSINLMWINAQQDEVSEFICSGKTREDMTYSLSQLKKWRVANPAATINFWYDSKCTNQTAVQNTQQCLNELNQETGSPINLCDIHEISFVQNNSDIFLSTLPVYYRIDYLKLIICLYLMEECGETSVVYTDFSICDKAPTALSKNELYTSQVIANLKKWGMLTARDPMKPENQFFQMLNTPLLIQSLKHAINCSLYLSVNALNHAINLQNQNISNNLNNVTFVTMVHVYIYLLCLKNGEPVQIRADIVNQGNAEEWVNYSPENHGYCMFGNFPKTWDLGAIQLNFETRAISRLIDVIKLPASLGMKPNITGILELSGPLGDSFLTETVRADLNPGKVGGHHSWEGPLPTPTRGDKFQAEYWPAAIASSALEIKR